MVHVGSAREVKGRTGFAHLFEHLLFRIKRNLGKGGLDKMSARIGGSGANGSTSRDRTNYLQTVPKDVTWLGRSDKLGWFINTVTVPVLEKEKQGYEMKKDNQDLTTDHTDTINTQNQEKLISRKPPI